MKKISTLLMASLIALSAFAVPAKKTVALLNDKVQKTIVTSNETSRPAKQIRDARLQQFMDSRVSADAVKPMAHKSAAKSTEADTVVININNLTITDMTSYYGAFFIEGSNEEWTVEGLAIASAIEEGTYAGDTTAMSTVMVWLTHMTATDTVEVELVAFEFTLSLSPEGRMEAVVVMEGADNKVYVANMKFVVPDAIDTVNVVIPAATMYNVISSQGGYQLYGFNADSTKYASLTIYADQVAGTFSLGDGSMDDYYTYLALCGASDTTFVDVMDGSATVSVSADGATVTANASLLGMDTVLYQVVMTAAYAEEDTSLEYDAESGDVNKTYTDADSIVFDLDYISYGEIYLDIEAADGSDAMALLFFVSQADPDIIIPAGVYPINNSDEENTVGASSGVNDEGYLTYSVYFTTDGESIKDIYFLVSGTVTVENINGHIKVTVDALNSNDVPVHIVYEASELTAIDHVSANAEKAVKFIGEDGQLYIRRAAQKYTATGIVVE